MRQRSWWLCGVAAVIVLPIAALGTAIAFLDPDDYKAQLAAAVQDATGRELTLGGPLRISRSLWPTIEVNDVKLANLPGGTRPDMARAERIQAQLSLPALLRRNIKVISLTLIGPDILFEQVDGHPNWVFDEAKEAVPSQKANGAGPAPKVQEAVLVQQADPAPQATEPRMTLSVQTVQVQNGMVTFRLPARTKVVGIRSLHSEHPVENGPLAVDAVLVYSDYAPFSLRATAQPTGNIDDPWTTQLDFAAFDTSATATGTMTLAGDYDLQMTAASPALEKLNALLPSMQLPPLHQATIATHFTNGPVRGDIPIIGTTRLHVGSIDLTDQLPGLSFGVVDVALPKAGAAASVAATGTYSGQAFNLAGSVGVPEKPDGRAVMPIDLTATASGQKAAGHVGMKGKLTLNTGVFGGLDAAMSLRTPALAGFRASVAPRLPALTNVSFDGQVTIPAAAGSIGVHGASVSTHEADFAGDAQIGLGSTMPVAAQLHGVRLDLEATLDAFGIAPASSAAGKTVIPDTPLPWSALRGLDIDLKAAVSAFHYQTQDWNDLNVAVKLKNSQLRLDLPGALGIALTADARPGNLVSLGVRATALPLTTIARAIGLPGPASGAMQIDAQLHAAGESLHDLAASLEGSFAATMTGGSISNAALVKLAAAALEALSITVPQQGETAIRCLGVVGAFSKGIGRFKTIALDTSYLQLDGMGEIDLGAEALKLKLRPLAALSGSHVSVPVLVDGPFRALNGRLDASGLDKVGLLIDALFGGDQPATCADAGLEPTRK